MSAEDGMGEKASRGVRSELVFEGKSSWRHKEGRTEGCCSRQGKAFRSSKEVVNR